MAIDRHSFALFFYGAAPIKSGANTGSTSSPRTATTE